MVQSFLANQLTSEKLVKINVNEENGANYFVFLFHEFWWSSFVLRKSRKRGWITKKGIGRKKAGWPTNGIKQIERIRRGKGRGLVQLPDHHHQFEKQKQTRDDLIEYNIQRQGRRQMDTLTLFALLLGLNNDCNRGRLWAQTRHSASRAQFNHLRTERTSEEQKREGISKKGKCNWGEQRTRHELKIDAWFKERHIDKEPKFEVASQSLNFRLSRNRNDQNSS